eukprot:COSAG04_NODE_5425_length_1624_cov_1.864262_3_plen_238_part_00
MYGDTGQPQPPTVRSLFFRKRLQDDAKGSAVFQEDAKAKCCQAEKPKVAKELLQLQVTHRRSSTRARPRSRRQPPPAPAPAAPRTSRRCPRTTAPRQAAPRRPRPVGTIIPHRHRKRRSCGFDPRSIFGQDLGSHGACQDHAFLSLRAQAVREGCHPVVRPEPCPHDCCWHSWNNATQMPAMIVRLTAVRSARGARELPIRPARAVQHLSTRQAFLNSSQPFNKYGFQVAQPMTKGK